MADALDQHDADAVAGLTCAKYQAAARSRIEDDPMLRIDFFGPPAQSQSLGINALTALLQAGLAPASQEAVRAVAIAIAMVDGDVDGHADAMHRVRQEGTSASIDRIDKIEVDGDSAAIDGAMRFQAFTQPAEVFKASNQAVRVNGEWKDCTPRR